MVAGRQQMTLLLVEAADQGLTDFAGAQVDGADQIIACRGEMQSMSIKRLFQGSLRRRQYVACRAGALRYQGREAFTGREKLCLALGYAHARRVD